MIDYMLKKFWPWLLAAGFVLTCCSCEIMPIRLSNGRTGVGVEIDESVPAKTADKVVEAITGKEGVVSGVAGKVLDSIEGATGIDPEAAIGAAADVIIDSGAKAVEDAASGNYIGTLLTIGGGVGALVSGYFARKKLKNKKKKNNK